MSFLIAGHGRAGTVWLSKVLNCGDHNVLHESCWLDPRDALHRLTASPKEGEVNNSLTGRVEDFIKDGIKIGIVIRHPKDQVRSHAKRPGGMWTYFAERLHWYRVMHDLMVCGRATIIRFEHVTTDKQYLEQVARELGIQGLNVPDELFKKTFNNHNAKPLRDYSNILKQLEWFTEYWYPE